MANGSDTPKVRVGHLVILHTPGRTEDVTHITGGRKTIEHVVHDANEVAAIVTRVHDDGSTVDVCRFDPAERPSPHLAVAHQDVATRHEFSYRAVGTDHAPSDRDER